MANPSSLSNGQSRLLDLIVTAGGVAKLKLGLGSKTVTGADAAGAWQGVATHADGDTWASADGVVIGGTIEGTLAEPGRNTNLTVLASAARTATLQSSDFTNYTGRFLHLVIDVTAVTATPSITVTVQGKDALSGQYYTLLAAAAITGTGTTVLRVGPALTAAANLVANDVLPKTWRVNVAHGDADSITYSIGASVV